MTPPEGRHACSEKETLDSLKNAVFGNGKEGLKDRMLRIDMAVAQIKESQEAFKKTAKLVAIGIFILVTTSGLTAFDSETVKKIVTLILGGPG